MNESSHVHCRWNKPIWEFEFDGMHTLSTQFFSEMVMNVLKEWVRKSFHRFWFCGATVTPDFCLLSSFLFSLSPAHVVPNLSRTSQGLLLRKCERMRLSRRPSRIDRVCADYVSENSSCFFVFINCFGKRKGRAIFPGG